MEYFILWNKRAIEYFNMGYGYEGRWQLMTPLKIKCIQKKINCPFKSSFLCWSCLSDSLLVAATLLPCFFFSFLLISTDQTSQASAVCMCSAAATEEIPILDNSKLKQLLSTKKKWSSLIRFSTPEGGGNINKLLGHHWFQESLKQTVTEDCSDVIIDAICTN